MVIGSKCLRCKVKRSYGLARLLQPITHGHFVGMVNFEWLVVNGFCTGFLVHGKMGTIFL